jgi:NAD(P)-dependent dehydrogenase (short-subunit alcohol dehydrogenase family)
MGMASGERKVALVTGGGRGIGLATARRFLQEGWRAAILDVDGDLLAAAIADLAAPDDTLSIRCDVSDPIQVQASVNAVAERFGRLDALVNNAGVAVFKPLLDTTFEEWSRVLAVNLTGPFLCTQAAAPVMAEHGGGSVVNITSISGLRASTLRVAYGTSKAGLAHLTKQQAVELASLGIRVNAVAPGPVDTAMAKAVHSPEIRADYHDVIPSTATASRRNSRKRSCSCPRSARATSRARCSRSTAASTRPGSDSPPCGASGGTGSGEAVQTTGAVAQGQPSSQPRPARVTGVVAQVRPALHH